MRQIAPGQKGGGRSGCAVVGNGHDPFVWHRRIDEWRGRDAAGLRVPILYMFSLVFMTGVAVHSKQKFDKKMVWLGLILALSGALGARFMLISLDSFTPYKISKIAYPIATAGSIVLFSLYSFLFLKEPFNI